MKHPWFLCLHIVVFCVIPQFISAQIEMPLRADTSKECSICHYRWLSTFFRQHRKTPLAELQEDPVVGTQAMCLSCHDGSVRDSRDKICNDPGHQVGITPSNRVSIPENFPLDDNGALQCSTCHTPHAVKAKKDTLVTFFLRAPNDNSSLCKRCHLKNTGGVAAGNHPTEVSAEKEYPAIVAAGGLFGTGKPNEIICETCHTPHGGVDNRRLVLSIEDPRTRSVLCEVCHTQRPGVSEDPTLNRSAHPLDLLPGKAAHIPQEWTKGNPVFLGTGGELVCRTCHKPHYAEDKEYLLVEHGDDGSLCVHCHHGQSPIIGSSHDLRKSAPGEKNILGKQARELGPCASCHLVHGGAEDYMWARTVHGEGSAPAVLCSSCHAPGYCAEEALPKNFSHPMGVSLAEGRSPVSLPLFNAMGTRNATGTISCSTCHDVHIPHPRLTDTPGQNKRQEKFLRDDTHKFVCAVCHGEESLFQFLYFHRDNSRKEETVFPQPMRKR